MSMYPSREGSNGCPAREELFAFGVGKLPKDVREAIAVHVEDCTACQAMLPALDDDTDPLVRDARGPVPPGLFSGTTDEQGPRPAEAGDGLPQVAGYTLLGELGRGAMGVVYQAEQVGLRRTVALKMILAGEYADPQEQARFRREAEAMARLQHPNIVQVYQVGEQAGRLFIALEYVDGGSLAQQLAGKPVEPRRAAELAETLARALDAAHQHKIVHRDLKPSNVLLTRDGVPKVTDFGLAKRLDVEGQTRTGVVMGTAEYMAPEQARGRNPEVGPAADVYALGATLYELLTGRPPFQGATLLETLEQVVSEEPVPPRRLNPRVPCDLETICLKCLQKEPRRRYESAQALADDLRCWQNGEPIWARPVGRIERVWRWCRRNPRVAGLSAAVALLLIGWSITATVLAISEAKAKEEALRRRKQYRDALDVQATLYLEKLLGRQTMLTEEHKQFLQQALKSFEELAAEVGQDEETRAGVARAHRRVGVIRSRLGDHKEAEQACHQALHFYKRLAADFPAVPDYRQGLATSHNDLGHMLAATGRPQEAEAEYRAALALKKRLAADFPNVPDYRHELARSHNNLGALLANTGRLKEAEAEHRAALGLRKQLVADFPAMPDRRQDLAQSHNNLGTLLQQTGRLQEAEAEYRAALALKKRLATDFPAVPDYRQELAASHNNLGQLLTATGRPQEAEAEHRAALGLRKQLAADFPAVPDYRQKLATSHNNLGLLLAATGRPQEAEAEYRAAVALQKQLAADFPAVPDYRQKLATSHNNLGNLLKATGRPQEAEAEYRAAVALQKQLAVDFPAVPACRMELAVSHTNLGSLLAATGRLQEAEAEFRAALAWLNPLAADFPNMPDYRQKLALSHNNLGLLLRQTGRPQEAEAEYRAACALQRQLAADFPNLPDHRQDLALSHNNLGLLLRQTGRPQEAEGEFRAALGLRKQLAADFPTVPEYQHELATTMVSLAGFHLSRKEFQAVRQLLEEALPYQRAALKANPQHPKYRQSFRNNLGGHALMLLALADHPAASDTAEQLAQAAVDPVRDTYYAACLLARCVPLAEKDDKLSEGRRQEVVQQYGDRALKLLRQAVQAGFKDGERLKKEKDLDPLRRLPDFMKLLAELEKR